MKQITLRKATGKDLNTLLHFEQEIIKAEQSFDVTLKKEHTNYYNLKEMLSSEDAEIVVGECNNEIIASGFVCIKKSDAFLNHQLHGFLGFMYTVPEYRGKGINRKIMEYLVNRAAEKGIKEFRLEVYEKNISAIKAYEKIGFSKHMIEMRKGI